MLEEDIRITKSREAILQAMETLLKQKPFRKITVNDICQTAVVGRTTFYSHFEDKYKLISYVLQQEQQWLEDIILKSPPHEVILNVLLDIQQNKRLYYNLFVVEVSEELQRLLQDTFNRFFTNILLVCKAEGVQLPSESLPLLVAYYTNGVVGMILWWAENDFSMPAEEVTSCLSNLLGYLWE
ncbi:TetR/AcrR family transcriptional regulator [Paenibacillus sp. SYP-B4298]|uniref:TetR/AcrR family transcriptional regulator n=1 Tax=Paenibacillus sp. SYP-B4298 TaxID=2996034 RepID=UPI0022DD715E|nr:TetR/AcrR family transcriptional regulator C-terminal domain-containing protein [Paenibacillus sp. SYP-B4298]